MDKDIKIRELEAKIPKAISSKSKSPSPVGVVVRRVMFEKYKHIFTETELQSLRSVEKDSTFVYKVVGYLYKANLVVLKNRCVQKKKRSAKTPDGKIIILESKPEITPDKKELVADMFLERLIIESKDDDEVKHRQKQLNKLLNSAITNYLKKNESSE